MPDFVDSTLAALKTAGPSPTLAVARRLGVSRQAARQRLERLAAEGLVDQAAADGRGAVGRPARNWSLTQKGHACFPDAHARLTLELIQAVRSCFGPGGLEALIARRESTSAATYRRALAGGAALEDKLEILAGLRTAEGYMAAWRRLDQGRYLFVEDHCPIGAAASACQGFCRAELDLFRDLLAPARVERTEHVIVGGRRCAYAIGPAAEAAP